MKFRLVWPILTPSWHKCLLRVAQQLGIKQCLERMIKNTSHLSRCRAQLVQNRDIIQKCNHGRYQYPVRGDEWLKCAECMNVGRAQGKSNFLVRFPELQKKKQITPSLAGSPPHNDINKKGGEKISPLSRPLRHHFYLLSHLEEPSAPGVNVVPSSA